MTRMQIGRPTGKRDAEIAEVVFLLPLLYCRFFITSDCFCQLTDCLNRRQFKLMWVWVIGKENRRLRIYKLRIGQTWHQRIIRTLTTTNKRDRNSHT